MDTYPTMSLDQRTTVLVAVANGIAEWPEIFRSAEHSPEFVRRVAAGLHAQDEHYGILQHPSGRIATDVIAYRMPDGLAVVDCLSVGHGRPVVQWYDIEVHPEATWVHPGEAVPTAAEFSR